MTRACGEAVHPPTSWHAGQGTFSSTEREQVQGAQGGSVICLRQPGRDRVPSVAVGGLAHAVVVARATTMA